MADTDDVNTPHIGNNNNDFSALKDNESRRRFVLEEFQKDSFGSRESLEFFLKQFSDKEILKDSDNPELLKRIAKYLKEPLQNETEAGWLKRTFRSGQRGRLLKAIDKQMQNIDSLKANRVLDLQTARLESYGSLGEEINPVDLKKLIADEKAKLNIKDNFWSKIRHPFKHHQARKLDKKQDRLFPEEKKEKLDKKRENFAVKLALGNSWLKPYYKIREKMVERGLKKLNKPQLRQQKNQIKLEKITQLQSISKDMNWGSKFFFKKLNIEAKLLFRRSSSTLNKKIVKGMLLNDVNKALSSGIRDEVASLEKDLKDKTFFTKAQIRKKNKLLNIKKQHLLMLENRKKLLDGKFTAKTKKIEDTFTLNKTITQTNIKNRADKINRKNLKLEQSSVYGKAMENILARVPEDKRKELEAVVRVNQQQTIVNDAEFKMLLKKKMKLDDKQIEEFSKALDLNMEELNSSKKDNKKQEETSDTVQPQETLENGTLGAEQKTIQSDANSLSEDENPRSRNDDGIDRGKLENKLKEQGFNVLDISQEDRKEYQLKNGDKELHIDATDSQHLVFEGKTNENGVKDIPSIEDFQKIARAYKEQGNDVLQIGAGSRAEYNARLMIAARAEGMDIVGMEKQPLNAEMEGISPETKRIMEEMNQGKSYQQALEAAKETSPMIGEEKPIEPKTEEKTDKPKTDETVKQDNVEKTDPVKSEETLQNNDKKLNNNEDKTKESEPTNKSSEKVHDTMLKNIQSLSPEEFKKLEQTAEFKSLPAEQKTALGNINNLMNYKDKDGKPLPDKEKASLLGRQIDSYKKASQKANPEVSTTKARNLDRQIVNMAASRGNSK